MLNSELAPSSTIATLREPSSHRYLCGVFLQFISFSFVEIGRSPLLPEFFEQRHYDVRDELWALDPLVNQGQQRGAGLSLLPDKKVDTFFQIFFLLKKSLPQTLISNMK